MDSIILVIFNLLFIVIQGYYHESSFSTRDVSDCPTIYMCPTFCWKLEKGCFICKCEASTTEYMTNAMEKMKEDYRPLKQTGSEYSLKQIPGGGVQSNTWSAIANANTFPGMGSLSGVYTFGADESSSRLLGSGNDNNHLKMIPQFNSFSKPQFSTSFQGPSQMLPGQCPLMDYSCPSSCWFTDTMTGCITCGCTAETTKSPLTLPTTTVTTEKTTAVHHTKQPTADGNKSQYTTSHPRMVTTTKDIHPTTTATPTDVPDHDKGSGGNEADVKLNVAATPGTRKAVCIPIDSECPLHCLNYDRKTFCALCECPTTTMAPTTVMATTTDDVITTTVDSVTTCKPLLTSCPIQCRTYDLTTYCPVCQCQGTTVPAPPSDECEQLSTTCPPKCVKLGVNGCPVCHCVDGDTTDIATTTTAYNCSPIRTDCNIECITYNPKTFCPLCVCPTESKSTTTDPLI